MRIRGRRDETCGQLRWYGQETGPQRRVADSRKAALPRLFDGTIQRGGPQRLS